MKDETIRAGDLVVVVRSVPCCGALDDIGQIFIAGDLYFGPAFCSSCHKEAPGEYVKVPDRFMAVKHLSRLKKIHPPSIETEAEREAQTT